MDNNEREIFDKQVADFAKILIKFCNMIEKLKTELLLIENFIDDKILI